ncbi:MAG TPA: Uma2 family endonuclease, partial [Allocoleopsis sp.]
QNVQIALFLLSQLLKLVPIQKLAHKDTEIVVSGSRATTRIPDLMVLSDELVEALQHSARSTILPDMPPPLLVVEVVSPGKANEDRDYRYKRSEYAARGIAEYWIVDPVNAQVMVLVLVEGFYEATTFQVKETIQSTLFSELELTVEQILNATDRPSSSPEPHRPPEA